MTPSDQRIVLRHGDARTITITCVAPASDPTWTLVDAPTLRWTVKRCLDDADSAAVMVKDLDDGITVTGDLTATITIDEADWDDVRRFTSGLVWDLEGRDDDGEPTTLRSGTIAVRPDVRRDAP